MRRVSSYGLSRTFGPGPVSSAVKALIIANGAVYLVSLIVPAITLPFELRPAAVIQQFKLWQVASYMFLHGSLLHILFNMLALWMFGTELERMWGSRFFVKYYFITGIGAAALMVLASLLPFEFSERMYWSRTIGASGAIYGLLLAYGLHFPDRPIYVYAIFPIPAKYFVMLFGGIAFLSSITASDSGTAHGAHLGGLLIGYLYLKSGRFRLHPMAEVKYRYLKWKINRVKRKFDVYSGGRADDLDRRIH